MLMTCRGGGRPRHCEGVVVYFLCSFMDCLATRRLSVLTFCCSLSSSLSLSLCSSSPMDRLLELGVMTQAAGSLTSDQTRWGRARENSKERREEGRDSASWYYPLVRTLVPWHHFSWRHSLPCVFLSSLMGWLIVSMYRHMNYVYYLLQRLLDP